MRLKNIAVAVTAAALLLGAAPASAQQSFEINLGYFGARAEDGRIDGDVLVVNRSYMLFDMDEFDGFYGEAAWALELGKYFEVGIGAGWFQRTVPAVYADWVHDDGREIFQDLKIRNIPITGMLRIFPIGHRRSVQPYVGVGVAMNVWRYAETGEFVDFADDSIYRESYEASGVAVGPVGLAGLRARVASQADLGVEWRYSWAEGDLNDDFLSDRIDLGGWSLLSTIKFRF